MKIMFAILYLISTILSAQSLNKQFHVEEMVEGGSDKIGGFNIVEYSVLSIDEKVIYKISNKTEYDIPYSKLEVFNNGGSVLINSFYGTLTFFDNSGTNLKKLKLSDNIGVEYERSIKSVVDGNTLVLLFNQQGDKFSTIQKYNFSGVVQTSFEVEILNVNGLAYSETLKQIYLSHIDWKNDGGMEKFVLLINENGEILKKYNSTFETGFFTENNLFVAFSNRSLLSINSETLEINFQKRSMSGKMFIDMTTNKESIIVISASPPKLESGKWYYKNPTIIKLNQSGEQIDKNKIETILFSEYGFNRLNGNLEFTAGNKHMNIE